VAGLDRLIEGYRRFRSNDWARERERWSELAEGQKPKVMVIACSDSRADPAQIFDTRPGEIFVVRNVAALVPPFETGGGFHGVSSALEFAVTQLKVEDIVVMGHGYCGGCAAALTGCFSDSAPGEGGFIAHWISMLDDARDRVRATHDEPFDRDAFRAMEHEGVQVSLANLRTFPWIRDREKTGELALHGAFFKISEGVLHILDQASGEFSPAS